MILGTFKTQDDAVRARVPHRYRGPNWTLEVRKVRRGWLLIAKRPANWKKRW